MLVETNYQDFYDLKIDLALREEKRTITINGVTVEQCLLYDDSDNLYGFKEGNKFYTTVNLVKSI